jgi:hypothetical protein
MSLFYPFFLHGQFIALSSDNKFLAQLLDSLVKSDPSTHIERWSLPVAVMHIPSMGAHETENEPRKHGTNDAPVKPSRMKQANSI